MRGSLQAFVSVSVTAWNERSVDCYCINTRWWDRSKSCTSKSNMVLRHSLCSLKTAPQKTRAKFLMSSSYLIFSIASADCWCTWLNRVLMSQFLTKFWGAVTSMRLRTKMDSFPSLNSVKSSRRFAVWSQRTTTKIGFGRRRALNSNSHTNSTSATTT